MVQSDRRRRGERWSLDGAADPSGRLPVTSIAGQFLLSRPDNSTITAHFPIPEPGSNVHNLRPVWLALGITIRPKEHGAVTVSYTHLTLPTKRIV